MSKLATEVARLRVGTTVLVALALALFSTVQAQGTEKTAKKMALTADKKGMANTPEKLERRAFIQAAMEEQDKAIAKQLEEMHRRGVYPLMRVTSLMPFGDWDFYAVKGGAISWTPNPGQKFSPVDVPEGFVTDLTSIPRIFWQLLRPEGRYAYAAVVHDYLYWTQLRPREEADQIFKFAMEDSKVDPATSQSIYQAVRTFGQSAWDTNARLKLAGECRELKRFPDDFTVSWNEWKRQPGVCELNKQQKKKS